ncbi:MAG: YajQ family cyclic di-GMP-binding protein [Omnitrophica bacterium RIFCSPHIGHO2_02_FULL_46_11]|nr:MAG: YajQ family cyclic di-GMP-binding protein [Omnitrophica bacterium RIFCSPLOWO2_01_FULL_45_10b]OGW87250.1 MAG: YajQ family cyclic di-GMP-binding protein [Omnitrophica bacterium RIFCSPHIGHO2_02_FULL_46_11]
MASEFSFDIVSQVDFQEVDNALNQALKEIKTRFDFKGSKSDLQFNRLDKKIIILADDDLKLKNVTEILEGKFAKRSISIKALKYNSPEKALDGLIRQTAEIVNGIPQEKAKEIVKRIKDLKIRIQPSIQGEQIRVSGKSKDDLQFVVQSLKNANLDLPLQFINYR